MIFVKRIVMMEVKNWLMFVKRICDNWFKLVVEWLMILFIWWLLKKVIGKVLNFFVIFFLIFKVICLFKEVIVCFWIKEVILLMIEKRIKSKMGFKSVFLIKGSVIFLSLICLIVFKRLLILIVII